MCDNNEEDMDGYYEQEQSKKSRSSRKKIKKEKPVDMDNIKIDETNATKILLV